MITVKKVFESNGKSVYQLFSDRVLGETIVEGNKIISEQTIPVREQAFNRDFMLRSVVFLLTEKFEEVEVAYQDDFYLTLGFEKTENGMKQLSGKIVFPSRCGGHH